MIRVVVALAFAAAAWFAFVEADPPAQLPAVALDQGFVYRLELLLVTVFAGLLIITPLLQGVLNGRLPTEITARGAKYDPADVADGLKDAQDRIAALEETIEPAVGDLVRLRAELAALTEGRDSR